MWRIERSVVPPILRMRSARASIAAKTFPLMLVEEKMVVAKVWSRDVPLGFALDQLRQNFNDLARCVAELSPFSPAPVVDAGSSRQARQ